MAYTPNTWATGDIITATKLNNMEQGIASAGGGGAIAVRADDETFALDKTWQELFDSGMVFFLLPTSNGYRSYLMSAIGSSASEYWVEFSSGDSYVTDSSSGYPVFEE